MSGLVSELQNYAADSSISVADLLRKALVIAYRLNLPDFKKWIESELNGYKASDDIPEYRTTVGVPEAFNPMIGWVPITFDNPDELARVSTRKNSQSIDELESMLNNSNYKMLSMAMPHSINVQAFSEGMSQTRLSVGKQAINAILGKVRNTVLSWSLKLGEEGIKGEGMSFSEQEIQKAVSSHSVNIQNFHGIIGDVTSSTVNQHIEMQIQRGDWDSLRSFLESKQIPDNLMSELQVAVDSDPQPKEKGKFGEKVSEWIGKAVTSAANGAWGIGIDVATATLTAAITQYYGM